MPASVRIIKIVKDVNPISHEEEEDYTIEFECIADNARDLAKELAACPLGARTIELIERAKFLPEQSEKTIEDMKKEADEEEQERIRHDEELREEGRAEIREKDILFLRSKKKGKAADLLQELSGIEEEEIKTKEDEEEETVEGTDAFSNRIIPP